MLYQSLCLEAKCKNQLVNIFFLCTAKLLQIEKNYLLINEIFFSSLALNIYLLLFGVKYFQN